MPRSKLTVELIELSQNPTIRTMFTNNNAGLEIDTFVHQHQLFLRRESDGIEITGESSELEEFIRTFLSEDSRRGAYSIVPLEKP